jgi:hypothetical protein
MNVRLILFVNQHMTLYAVAQATMVAFFGQKPGYRDARLSCDG